jgi:hypothetical protein
MEKEYPRMKRILCLSAVALVGLASSALGGPFACLNGGIHCICPPEECENCRPPCENRLHLCSCRKSEQAQKLIEQLSGTCCCDRIRAAHKLGSRLHADFCCDPEVLSALARALQCDPCWEVRVAAAWGIAYQNARTDLGVMSLYVASKLDPHFLVRDAANDALGVLLVCRRSCFKEVFAAGDELIKKLKGKYKPGSDECIEFAGACQAYCAGAHHASTPAPAAPQGKHEAAAAPLPRGTEPLRIEETAVSPTILTPPSR